ncbi:uncharacterized protein [Hemitrygon akajei]|uniref:uncharacterized protein isoform X1 n=1 Tax=Hemitrygon akajei TaxID=2704970 RepID=UPI003BFA0B38
MFSVVAIVVGLSIYVSQIRQSKFTSEWNCHESNSSFQSKLSALNSNLSVFKRMHSDLRHQFTEMETKYRSVSETKAQICDFWTSRRGMMSMVCCTRCPLEGPPAVNVNRVEGVTIVFMINTISSARSLHPAARIFLKRFSFSVNRPESRLESNDYTVFPFLIPAPISLSPSSQNPPYSLCPTCLSILLFSQPLSPHHTWKTPISIYPHLSRHPSPSRSFSIPLILSTASPHPISSTFLRLLFLRSFFQPLYISLPFPLFNTLSPSPLCSLKHLRLSDLSLYVLSTHSHLNPVPSGSRYPSSG